MKPRLVTKPTGYFISLEEAKKQARVFFDDDNDYIETLIAAACGHLDGYHGVLGRCVLEQTWQWSSLCYKPYQRTLFTDTIAATATVDGESVDVTFDADHIRFATVYPHSEIVCSTTHAAPEHMLPMIKQAALTLVAHWWMNRTPVTVGNITNVPWTFEAIISPLRVGVYAW